MLEKITNIITKNLLLFIILYAASFILIVILEPINRKASIISAVVFIVELVFIIVWVLCLIVSSEKKRKEISLLEYRSQDKKNKKIRQSTPNKNRQFRLKEGVKDSYRQYASQWVPPKELKERVKEDMDAMETLEERKGMMHLKIIVLAFILFVLSFCSGLYDDKAVPICLLVSTVVVVLLFRKANNMKDDTSKRQRYETVLTCGEPVPVLVTNKFYFFLPGGSTFRGYAINYYYEFQDNSYMDEMFLSRKEIKQFTTNNGSLQTGSYFNALVDPKKPSEIFIPDLKTN